MKSKRELAIKNVKVTESTHKKLEDYKVVDSESMNSVIKRLLEKNEVKNGDRESNS